MDRDLIGHSINLAVKKTWKTQINQYDEAVLLDAHQ